LRAISMPVASPDGLSWEDLRKLIKTVWRETTRVSNWMNHPTLRTRYPPRTGRRARAQEKLGGHRGRQVSRPLEGVPYEFSGDSVHADV
jgi:hypothetical protein